MDRRCGGRKDESALGRVVIMIEFAVRGEIPRAFASLTCFLFALTLLSVLQPTYCIVLLLLVSTIKNRCIVHCINKIKTIYYNIIIIIIIIS